MKLAIYRNGENIVCIREFHDPESKGEIAHFLAELELTKQELLELWEAWNE
jgi:hypothetical protein